MPRGTIFVNQQNVAPLDSPPNSTVAATGEKEADVDDSALAKELGVPTRLIREDREASQRHAREKLQIFQAVPAASLNVDYQTDRLAEYNIEQLVDSTTFTSGPTDKGPGGAVQLDPQQQNVRAGDHLRDAYNFPKPSPSSAVQQQQAAYPHAASVGQHRDAHNPPPPSSATDPRSGTPSDNPYQLAFNSAVELLDTSPQQYGTIKWMGYLPRVRPLVAGVELVC